MSLLGSMCLSREAIGDVIPIISKADVRWFYRPDHRILFDTLLDLYDQNKEIDLVVVRDELQRRGELEHAGGAEHLVSCAESVPTHLHARRYAEIVRDKGILRDLIGVVNEIAEDAYADIGNTWDLLDRAESKFYSVTERRVTGQSVAIGDLVRELSAIAESGQDGALTGLPSGFHKLDELTSGFQPGDFVVIAGRPSMGKTALGLNIAEHVAVDEETPVAFYSLEMSKQQVAQRLVCSRQRIDSHKFRRRMLNDAERDQVSFAVGQFQDVPLFVDDTPGMTILELRTKARRLAQQHKIKAVFVDYLQLMRAPGTESRQHEISTISGGLKALGRELNIPIIALAQLNRMAEGREGHRPRMSDLRESGAIEQDADVILLLHREEYYKKEDPSVRNLAEIIIAKQRNGPTDTVQVTFNHQFTRFDNFSPLPEPAYVADAEGSVPF